MKNNPCTSIIKLHNTVGSPILRLNSKHVFPAASVYTVYYNQLKADTIPFITSPTHTTFSSFVYYDAEIN